MVKQLGLKSKSHGKGEQRKVVVSNVCVGGGIGGVGLLTAAGSNHVEKDGLFSTEADYKQVPRIHVGTKGKEALRKHLSKFPPSAKEDAKSRETGSSMLSQYNEITTNMQNSNGNALLDQVQSESTSGPRINQNHKQKTHP